MSQYLAFAQSFFVECESSFVPCIRALAKRNLNVGIVVNNLKLIPGLDVTEGAYNKMHETSLVFKGGFELARGSYKHIEVKNSLGYFEKTSTCNDEMTRFTINKRKNSDGSYHWCVAVAAGKFGPRISDMIVYTLAVESVNEIMPRKQVNWFCESDKERFVDSDSGVYY